MSPPRRTGVTTSLLVGGVVLAVCAGACVLGGVQAVLSPSHDTKPQAAASSSASAPEDGAVDAAVALPSDAPSVGVPAVPSSRPSSNPSPKPSSRPSSKPPPKPKPSRKPSPQHRCDPNYADACVPIASDVDCAGGGGNGPAYFYGVARVVGTDIYDLDRDNDGWACEKN